MANALIDPLHHNSWANAQLFEFCRGLRDDQLRATADGTYGTILATLQHVVGAEGRYASRLAGRDWSWPTEPEETEDLGELARMADDLARFWRELGEGEFDPDRIVSFVSRSSGAEAEARAGILVAQALNHGNEHRSQIATILTTIGVEPPELDGWHYAIESGRFREGPLQPEPLA
jgi:uncharacterized damage-inducible protein DinB